MTDEDINRWKSVSYWTARRQMTEKALRMAQEKKIHYTECKIHLLSSGPLYLFRLVFIFRYKR